MSSLSIGELLVCFVRVEADPRHPGPLEKNPYGERTTYAHVWISYTKRIWFDKVQRCSAQLFHREVTALPTPN